MTADERADVLVDDRGHDAPLGEARPAIADAIRQAVLEEREATCKALQERADALDVEATGHAEWRSLEGRADGLRQAWDLISSRPPP